jgi:hypothetical protein
MAPQLIYVIRHAEKPPDSPPGAKNAAAAGVGGPHGVDFSGRVDQHSLTPRGWQRSGALAVLFTRPPQVRMPTLAVPDRLLAPDYGGGAATTEHRTYQTLLGLSDPATRPIISDFPLGGEAQLAKVVLADTADAVLICWEHKNIPRITGAIPVDPATPVPDQWPDQRFDLIWQFHRSSTDPLVYQFTPIPQAVLDGDENASTQP